MLKVIDGLRTKDHANMTIDIPSQSINGAQVNSAGIDMSNFAELLVVGLAGAITGTGVATMTVQESNEPAANFSNITNAVITLNTANTQKVHSVDWRKPMRKRYARVIANTTNAVVCVATTLRVRPMDGQIDLGDNCGQADS